MTTLLVSLLLSAPELRGYLNIYDYLDHSGGLAQLGLMDHHEGPALLQDRGGFRLQLRLDGRPSERVAYEASLNFEYEGLSAARQPTDDPDDGFRVFPKEAYIDLISLGPLDLRLGRQFLFWGRFEWGGVLDLLAPWDFNSMSAEKENFRLPVDALDLRLYLGELILEAALLPFFQPTRMALDLPDSMGPPGAEIQVEQAQAVLPSRRPSDWESALRLGYEGHLFYLGLSAYRGHDRIFSLHMETEGEGFNTELIRFTPIYHSLSVLGLEAEALLGPLSLKLEGGYLHTEDDSGEDPFIDNRRLSWVGGLDWTVSNSLSLNLQYGQTFPLGYDRQAEFEARQALGEPDPYVERSLQHRLVGRLRYAFSEELKWQLMSLVNLPDTNLLALTFLAWDPLPATRIYLGTILFRGPSGTTFGRLEGQSRLFSELKVMF